MKYFLDSFMQRYHTIVSHLKLLTGNAFYGIKSGTEVIIQHEQCFERGLIFISENRVYFIALETFSKDYKIGTQELSVNSSSYICTPTQDALKLKKLSESNELKELQLRVHTLKLSIRTAHAPFNKKIADELKYYQVLLLKFIDENPEYAI